MEIAQRKHFFISYSSMDQQWAQWIAWQLESANYTTILQAWDFRAGNNLILAVDTALRQAERILALLSPDYLASSFSSIEWANAILRDPRGEDGLLVPVLIRHCPIEGLLSQLIPIDLTNQDEQTARTILLDKVQLSRRKPASAPNYPDIPTLAGKQPSFPNSTQEPSPLTNNLDGVKTKTQAPTTPSDIVAQYTHHQKTHGCTIYFTLSQKHTLEYQLEWHGFKGDRFTLTLDKHCIIDTGRQFLGIPHLQKSFEVENIKGSFSYINQRNPSNPVNRFKVSITLGKTILFEKEDGWNS